MKIVLTVMATLLSFKKRMLAQGIDQSDADTPEKYAAFLKSEIARWSKVIKEADVRAE